MERWEQCLAKTVEVLTPLFQLNDLREDPNLSNITTKTQTIPSLLAVCLLHDNLTECFQQTEVGNNSIFLKTSDDVSHAWFSCGKKLGPDLIRRFMYEADLYRAIQVTSHYLHGKLPRNSEAIDCLRESLQYTAQKAKILLKLLSKIYAFFITQSTELSSLPTNYPVLQHWLDKQREVHHRIMLFSNEHNKVGAYDDDILCLDKEALAHEERDLLQMASTPTSLEAFGTANLSGPHFEVSQDNPNINMDVEVVTGSSFPLLARLETNRVDGIIAKDTMSTPVALYENGIICARDDSKACWALTASSKIDCKPPIVTITSILLKHGCNATTVSLGGTSTSLSLQVGSSSLQWWEEISKIINALQEIQELRTAATTLWRSDKDRRQDVRI